MILRIDPRLQAAMDEEPPADWATRLLFSRPDAMHLYATRPQPYRERETGDPVIAAYADLLAPHRCTFRSLISIGAADGYVDLRLPLAWDAIRYTPVDIARTMVEAALTAARLRGVEASGIVADAEDAGAPLVEELVADAPPPRLVVCLGNVLGNLDLGEYALLRRVRALLDGPESRLMLSVALGRFPRPLDRSTFDARVGWSDLCPLLAAGVARRTGENVADVAQAMTERLAVASSISDVPDADTLLLSDRLSGVPLLHLRRYAFPALLRWLTDTFELRVAAVRDLTLPDSADVRLGIVLLAPSSASGSL